MSESQPQFIPPEDVLTGLRSSILTVGYLDKSKGIGYIDENGNKTLVSHCAAIGAQKQI